MTDQLPGSDFKSESELNISQSSSDRGSSAVDSLNKRKTYSKVPRKSRRTLLVDMKEDLEKEIIQNGDELFSSGDDGLSKDNIKTPATSGLIDDEPGFDIEISIPVEPAREVLRRSSSRERGRGTRSSSKEAIRQVRARSKQRRSERENKESLDLSNGSLDPTPGKMDSSSPRANHIVSSGHNEISLESSMRESSLINEAAPAKKQTGSPRRGTRSRSSDRALGSSGNIGRIGGGNNNMVVGQPQERPAGRDSDRLKSNSPRINQHQSLSRERRRSRRDNKSSQDVPAPSHPENVERDEKVSLIEGKVEKHLGSQNATSAPDILVEKSGTVTKVEANQKENERRRALRNSSRDILQTRRSDSKERTRRSRGVSEERPAGKRSSSQNGRGSRSKEGFPSPGREKNLEADERTGRNVRRSSSEDFSPQKAKEISTESVEKEDNTRLFLRCNSRENVPLHKTEQASVARGQKHESMRQIVRRNSRENDLQFKIGQVAAESGEKKESTSQLVRRSSRENISLQKTEGSSAASNDKIVSTMTVVARNSPEKVLSRKTHEASPKSTEKNQSRRQVGRRGCRDGRTRRSTREHSSGVQSENFSIEKKPSSETFLKPRIDVDQSEDTKKEESGTEGTARAIPVAIIHEEEEEKKRIEFEKAEEKLKSCVEINPAMALLSHLGLSVIDSESNIPDVHQQVEPLKALKENRSVSGHCFEELSSDNGNQVLLDHDMQHTHSTDYAFLTQTASEATDIDSMTDESVHHAKGTEITTPVGQEVVDGANSKETQNGFGIRDVPAEPLGKSYSEKLSGKKQKRSKEDNLRPEKAGTDSHPADDLLGFLGSNYDDLQERETNPLVQTPCDVCPEDQAECSVDFFRAMTSTNSKTQSREDDFERVERLVDSFDESLGEESKPLAPPSVAPLETPANQKARMTRRVARQNKLSLDKLDANKPSTLAPPSLAGDMSTLMNKRVRKPKTEEVRRASRGLLRSKSDEGPSITCTLDVEEEHVKKVTSRPKIRRAKISSNGDDEMCEQSLAPPSLAPSKIAPTAKTRPMLSALTAEKEEDAPRKVTRREARKATQFASLDEDNDDDSVGLPIIETSPAVTPKRRGMLAKAQSAVNVFEKTTKRVVKKAVSTKNLFG